MADDVELRTAHEGASAESPLSEEKSEELRRQLARAVSRVCPRWLAAEVEDIVQCAWLKLTQALREGNGAFASSYLWRVAYCATVDEIRRRRRRGEVPLDETAMDGPTREASADPERVHAGAQIGHGVRDCLRRLDEPRRLAVVLHLQGHTVPEASRILGWGDKRVENLVYRGLDELRRCLRAKGLAP